MPSNEQASVEITPPFRQMKGPQAGRSARSAAVAPDRVLVCRRADRRLGARPGWATVGIAGVLTEERARTIAAATEA